MAPFNYHDGSIVNLMSSLARSLGGKSLYPTLTLLPPDTLKDSRNIVLMVFDGIGYEYVKQKGRNTLFQQHLKGKMSSVFPPTTAAAITTFATGTAPQQHAFTGWFMHLRELGVVSTILPFTPRAGGVPFSWHGASMQTILGMKGFTSGLRVPSYIIVGQGIKDTDFTRATSGNAQRRGYKTLAGFFAETEKCIRKRHRRAYIYAYWSGFDSISHSRGVNSRQAEQHFRLLDRHLRSFLRRIRDSGTTLVITSDHGFVDCTKRQVIQLDDHPRLKECLTLPLCGEGRAVYCYVRPARTRQFEEYVRTRLAKFCSLHRSEELIDKGYFGLFKPNPKLADRIGDYILIMKGNYTLKDSIPGQQREFHIGNHGGISDDEVFVPLIVVKP
jgi:predicted AlkP superfamily pyrophosphatase or phosphodiesterase